MEQRQMGRFISELRKEKGMTQVQLGEALGVTNKTVSRWENGNYMPDISIMEELCRQLDISVNELFCCRRLQEKEFEEAANQNLLVTLQRIKGVQKRKRLSEQLNAAGVGALLSVAYPVDSTAKMVVIVISFIMVCINWYYSSRYDKAVNQAVGYAEE